MFKSRSLFAKSLLICTICTLFISSSVPVKADFAPYNYVKNLFKTSNVAKVGGLAGFGFVCYKVVNFVLDGIVPVKKIKNPVVKKFGKALQLSLLVGAIVGTGFFLKWLFKNPGNPGGPGGGGSGSNGSDSGPDIDPRAAKSKVQEVKPDVPVKTLGGKIANPVVEEEDDETDKQYKAFLRKIEENEKMAKAAKDKQLEDDEKMARELQNELNAQEEPNEPAVQVVAPVKDVKKDKKAGENEGDCELCMSKIEPGIDLIIFPCGHKYHKNCVEVNNVKECNSCDNVDDKVLDNNQKCIICGNARDIHEMSCCKSKFCKVCLNDQINAAMDPKDLKLLKCPSCAKEIDIKDIILITNGNKDKLDKFEEFKFNEYKAKELGLKYCPTEGCKNCFANEANEKITYRCSECDKSYCASCLKNHSQTISCEQAIENEKNNVIAKLTPMEREKQRKDEEETSKIVRPCPRCRVNINKTDGCNHMNCSSCKLHYCWECLENRPITQDNPDGGYPHDHFDVCPAMNNGRNNNYHAH